MFIEYLSRKCSHVASVGRTLLFAVSAVFLINVLSTGNVWAEKVNLLINGSFEQSSVTPPNGLFSELPTGSLALTGWKVETNLEYINLYWQTKDGTRSIDINASPSKGKISQSFPTQVGKWYQVDFLLAGNPNCSNSTIKKIAVTAASTQQEFTFDVTGHTNSNMGWTEETFTFQAIGTTTTLIFSSLTDGGCGAALDKVEVYAVETNCPEHAVYSVTNGLGKLTIPFVEVPLWDQVTHLPTGELAVFKAELKQLGGLNLDFGLVSSQLKLLFLTPSHEPCHAVYDETKKTLHLPFVDVGDQVYDVTLQHLQTIPLDLGVFHLQRYQLVQ